MKRFFSEFQIENKPERLIKLLFNWRIWILGGILGALFGAGIYAFLPPRYRAYASVVVDHNIEEAFVFFEDRDLFTFMHRETEKLKTVAWSDEVLGNVAAYGKKISSEDLNLDLAQDGVWSFYVDSDDLSLAQDFARAWASEFSKSSYAAVEVSAELEIARDALEDFLADNPDAELRDINPYLDEIRVLQESVKGISQYIDISPISSGGVAARSGGLGAYIILSAIALILLLLLVMLLLPQKNRGENV
jgi:hypothetical protein